MKEILALAIATLMVLSTFSMLGPRIAAAVGSKEAPVIEWSKAFGGSGDDNAYSVVQTSDMGYALAGSTTSFGAGKSDMWLVKTDLNGKLQWNKAYGGLGDDHAECVIETSGGGYALAGSIGQRLWDDVFERWWDNVRCFGLVRADTNGNMMWNKTWVYGPWYDDIFGGWMNPLRSVVQTDDEGFLVVGCWEGAGGGEGGEYRQGPAVLIRTNSSGYREWDKEYWYMEGYPYVFQCESCIRTSNGFALAGYVNFDPMSDSSMALLVRINATGGVVWLKEYWLPSPEFDLGRLGCVSCVVQTSDDGFALAGSTASGLGYPGNFWLVRTDANGDMIWNKTYISGVATSLALTSDGGYLLAGNSGNTACIIKADSVGNEQWYKTYAGLDFRSIIRVSNDEYVLAGSTADSSGHSDFLLMKIALCFADGFESGTFSNWSGVSVSSGEAASVVSTIKHHGTRSALFASNGGGGFEKAYCYKTITSRSDLYTRGYFYVSQSGIIDERDRFYFLLFRAGTTGVACAGWKKINGIVKWLLTVRVGTSLVDFYSSSSPSRSRWYCVELHWKKGTLNGLAELWINGVRVCSASGKNTAIYGNVNQVQFGLPQIYNCGPTRVYGDCCVVARTYVGPEPSPLSFADGFESGSFSKWSGVTKTYGETASVVYGGIRHHGLRSARFTSNGGRGTEYAYCYKTVAPSVDVYARGYFYISKSSLTGTGNGGFYLIAFRAESGTVAYAGWREEYGSVEWCLVIKDGTSSRVCAYESGCSLNTWHCVELHWGLGGTNGMGELWVDGERVYVIAGAHTAAYGKVSQVRFGLPFISNCGSTTVYCDCAKIASGYIGPEH